MTTLYHCLKLCLKKVVRIFFVDLTYFTYHEHSRYIYLDYYNYHLRRRLDGNFVSYLDKITMRWFYPDKVSRYMYLTRFIYCTTLHGTYIFVYWLKLSFNDGQFCHKSLKCLWFLRTIYNFFFLCLPMVYYGLLTTRRRMKPKFKI